MSARRKFGSLRDPKFHGWLVKEGRESERFDSCNAMPHNDSLLSGLRSVDEGKEALGARPRQSVRGLRIGLRIYPTLGSVTTKNFDPFQVIPHIIMLTFYLTVNGKCQKRWVLNDILPSPIR